MFRIRGEKTPISRWQSIGKMANKRKTTQLDQQIDENLRRVYADAAQEPIPDRFAKLLEQLRTRTEGEQPKTAEDQS